MRALSTRRTSRTAALLTATVLALAACGDGEEIAAPVSAPRAMTIDVYPAYESENVEPDSVVTVASAGGLLDQVEVTDSTGTVIGGTLSPDRTAWVADRRLAPGERYEVSVAGTNERGARVSQISRFRTLTVAADKRLASYLIGPPDGSTVGIAQPVVVQFNRPVTDRAAVLQALEVETSEEVEGGWYWIDASEVHWRPKEFWPPGTKVTIRDNLVGIDAGNGVWGVSRRESSFTVGREQVLKVDVRKHQMKVVRNGKVIKTFDVSTGKAGWETRNGIKVLMEKVTNKKWTNEAIDAPEEYTLRSSYAMRMTNSGEFVHDAPWNGRIGRDNTSHGCVGMRVGDMRWLFSNSIIGDPVIVTGSPKKFNELWNRYQDWNVDWEDWQDQNLDLSDG